jgi:hypothetical protein
MLPDGALMADSPTFSIYNEFEREQTYIPGDWNTVDTITQEYSLNWSETYSSRLALDIDFELQFEDVLRSLDVDQKTVEPSLDLNIKSLIWDLSLVALDTIDFTNEFNVKRKDALEYGAELDLFPYYLPTLQVKSQRLIDTQENLEDKVEQKFDANMEYELSEILGVSLSWKEEKTDDRLFDNNDIDSHDWEFILDYGQTMTPSLKVDFQTNWYGNKEEVLNNAGQVLNTDREHEIEHKLKFSLDTFPDFDSSLELGYLTDFVENGDESTIDFTVGYDQPIVELGTLTETLTITRERIDLKTEKTTDLNIDLDIELAGVPDRYLDYSIKYTLSLSDLENEIDPTANKEGQDDEFDISVTLTPNEKATIENSFNWSATKENGVQSDSSKDIKVKGTFEGELFNVPNLVFTPLLELSREKDFVTGEIDNVSNLELECVYTFALPPTTSWEITSVYSWEREDDLERAFEFTSDFIIEFVHPSWDVQFQETAYSKAEFDTGEPTFWEHDITFTIGKDLTPVIRFDTTYTYEYDGDDYDSDELEAVLEWEYRSTFLSLGYTRDRVFEGPKDVVRVYTAELAMEF